MRDEEGGGSNLLASLPEVSALLQHGCKGRVPGQAGFRAEWREHPEVHTQLTQGLVSQAQWPFLFHAGKREWDM